MALSGHSDYSGQGGGEGFWDVQITTPGNQYTVGGIGAVATASGATSGAPSRAYLDSFDSGKPAGVGRVRDTAGAATETLTLTVTTPVKLTDLLLRNSDHNTFIGSLQINGILFSTTNGELNLAALAALSATTTFNFFCLAGDVDRLGKDFYVSAVDASAVPLPGALPLFATALACWVCSAGGGWKLAA